MDLKQLRILIMAGLCAISFIAFQPALSAGFLSWDDPSNITGVPQIQELSAANLKWMFFDYGPDIRYKPVTYLTWALIHSVKGLDPWLYHFIGLISHIVATMLVFLVLLRLGEKVSGESENEEQATWMTQAAGAATLFWAVHPLRVESTAWATALSYPQAVCFLCLATLAYLRLDPARSFFRQGTYWWALGAFQLAMISYPAAVGYSFVIVALGIVPFGRIKIGSIRETLDADSRRGWLETIPFFVLTAGMIVVGIIGQYVSQGAFGKPLTLEEMPMSVRLQGAAYFLAYYAWRPLYPFKMYTLNEDLVNMGEESWRIILACVFIAAITIYVIVKRRQQPAMFALWFAFSGLTGPILKLTGGTPQPGPGDRYSMIPGLAWTAAMFGLLLLLRSPQRRKTALAILLVVGACFTIQSRTRSYVWHSDVTFFGDQAVTLEGGYRVQALARWGKGLIMAGEMDAGLEKVAEAWQLGAPYLVEEIGTAFPQMLISQGREEEALAVLRQARQLQPDNLEILKLTGMALLRTGRYQQGRSIFESLIQRLPDSPEPFFAYAVALATLGEADAAVAVAKSGL
ncbi:MAG: tetratricopeptide repeat protein, partial [Limisphaerales bacterium]